MARNALVLLVVAGSIAMYPQPARSWQWNHTGVDTTGGLMGQFNSLVLGKTGRIHASYYRNDSFDEGNRNLKYATKLTPAGSAGSWTKIIVDGNMSTGTYSSIALTGSGVPHIAYYDSYLGDLKHAWYDSALVGWRTERVDEFGTVGQYAAIAAAGESLYIAYLDATTPALKVATKFPGSAWSFTLVDTNGAPGFFTSIAAGNGIHIAYYDLNTSELRYAKNVGGGWIVQTIDALGDVGRYTSIISESIEGVCIAYYDNSNKDLKFAAIPNGGGWGVTTIASVGDVGRGTSIAADRMGRPHVLYYDNIAQDLKYVGKYNATWVQNTIATGGNVGRFCSLEFDNNNLPNVLYSDETAGKLRYAYGVGTQTGIEDPVTPEPSTRPYFALRPFPNPMNPTTTIEVRVDRRVRAQLRIFDVQGRFVRDLFDGTLDPGPHGFVWDGRDDSGIAQSSGAYFAILESPEGRAKSKIVLLK